MRSGFSDHLVRRLIPGTAIIAIVLASCMVFSSCSRSDQTSVKKLEKITLSYAAPPYTVLADIALVKGFFRQEGLDVTPRFHTSGKAALGDVLEGKADFATVAETPFMFAAMAGQKISIIATIQASSKVNAIVARKDKGIRSPRDLKGKRISLSAGTTADFFLDVFLADQDISRSEVTVVDLNPELVPEALVNGKIDAASAFQIYLVEAQKRLGSNGITFYNEEIYTETFNIAARQDYIRKYPARIQKLIRSLIRAEEFVAVNPGESQRLVADFRKVDKALLNAVWEGNTFQVTLNQALIFSLEDESRWAITRELTGNDRLPDYLDYIYLDALESVKPRAVRIVR
jgi:ABC-type nitrate/sulfonate/bicarbonate transport system substrate-binding protein